jgi:hypothetical protein
MNFFTIRMFSCGNRAEENVHEYVIKSIYDFHKWRPLRCALSNN